MTVANKKTMAPIKKTYAWSIAVNGKRAKEGQRNPYAKGVVQHYVWLAGKMNPSTAAAEIVEAMAARGYPIEES